MKLLISSILLFIFAMNIFAQTAPPIETGVSQALARWRAANYSDVRYKLNVTLEKGAPLMKGIIEISVNLTETGAGNKLILDWRTTQFENDKDKPYARVTKINDKSLTNANELVYSIFKEHLQIGKEVLKTGENVIEIEFASPIKTSGSAVTRYIDKEDGAEYLYSLFVPSDASTAFPLFDQPDLKARFKLEVTSRTFDRVVSNAVGKTSDYNTNTNKFAFSETKPISTYVFAFAAGDFVDFQENRPVNERGESIKDLAMEGSRENFRFFVRRSQTEKFKPHEKEVFRLNREGVKFLESYFDYKFPFPKYDLVLIPEFPFGGMEHAGCTFLRESSVIFPTEPTKNDLVSRANVIFHEAAHQWFGDTVTMKWFDDLWLKEGFAEFMAYKTLERVMPEYNAWKIFYERNKQAAYLSDSTRGTTPIYQEIPNLSAAKSAYGNIVYRKAPSFLKQAEFYLGEKEFQTAVRQFLKKHEFANAEWTDLVKEFETASKRDLKDWANVWVKQRGLPIVENFKEDNYSNIIGSKIEIRNNYLITQRPALNEKSFWQEKVKILTVYANGSQQIDEKSLRKSGLIGEENLSRNLSELIEVKSPPKLVFTNYQDYGYGIFLLDEKSRAYVLANIQNEKDDFLRAMMWGSLWDSVREMELAPKDYVELVIKNVNVETDESTIQTLLGRVSTAMNYYLSDKQRAELAPAVENLLIDKIKNAPTRGLQITFYRALLNIAATERARRVLRDILSEKLGVDGGNTKMRAGMTKIGGKIVYAANPLIPLMPKDRADIITRLIVTGDADALNLLKEYERSAYIDADRYAYAARAAAATAENKAKYWNDFTNNKNLSENWIEAAFVTFNSPCQSDLTLPFLKKALTELPNLKRNRKIFFVNGWLAAFIGGQKSEEALNIVNKFLADNPNLDRDLRLKILENTDGLERAVKIRRKYGK